MFKCGFEVLRLGRMSACHVSGESEGQQQQPLALDRLNFPPLKGAKVRLGGKPWCQAGTSHKE